MNIYEAITNANGLYRKLKKASIRQGDKDSPLTFRGNLMKNGETSVPCGLLVCQTTLPEAILKIIVWDALGKLPPLDTVSEEALSELGGIVSMHKGLGGILWLNAGQLGILGPASLANTARSYEKTLVQEEGNKPFKKRSRELHWDQFTLFNLVSVSPKEGKKGKTIIAADWIAALRNQGAVVQDVQESQDEPEQTESNSTDDDQKQGE